MKNIFIYIAFLAISLTVSSCSEEIVSPVSDSPMLTIHLSSSDLQTKAPMAGVEQLNENFIKTIHYFLYPMGKTNEPALLHNSTKPITTSKQTLESFNVPLDETLLSKLFVYPQEKCKVFLIVNLPEGTVIPTDTSIDNLKKIAVEANFSSLPVGSFVMTGEGEATLQSRTLNPAAEGNINVDRVASKLTLNITVKNTFKDGEGDDATIWTSQPEAMKVSLYNCVNNAELSGEPLESPSRFDILERTFAVTPGTEVTECACDPFYSYPVEWAPGSEDEPYLFIMLPWTDGTGDGTGDGISYRPCYYKVILSDTRLYRNNWYNINLTLDVLGSFNETEPTVVINDVTYYVLDWRDASDNASDADVNADIHGARYLVVDQNKYEVFNESSISIPFTTSHDCEVVNVSCKYPDLVAEKDVDESAANYSINIENGQVVTFTHTLNNDMFSDDFDFTPFTIKFTIRHKDDDDFKEEITIVQYPAIYAVGQRNSDTNSTGHGNVWVNGYNDDDTSPNAGQDFFGGANGNRQGAYPSMYVFTITTTEGTDFIIGDPRDSDYTYQANDADWFVGDALYDGDADRELKYYYGTAVASERYSSTQTGSIYTSDEAAEAAEPTINMVAPKFRLASGYGTVTQTTGANSLETMKKRCASYQEDGYPAGRWRLPTRAEFQFVLTQINLGNLPTVYLETYDYWCAHGLGEPVDGVVRMNYISNSQGGGYSSITPVRCVYDEWYWENSETYRLGVDASGKYTPFNTFTWGDMPRDQFDAKTE